MNGLDEVERLGALKERGLLSEAEFEAGKRRALGTTGARGGRRRLRGLLAPILLVPVLLAGAFAGGMAFQTSLSQAGWTRAAAAEIDPSGIVRCSAAAVSQALLGGLQVSAGGKPLELSLGPVRQGYSNETVRVRQCAATFLSGPREVGTGSVWIQMMTPDRFRAAVERSVSAVGP